MTKGAEKKRHVTLTEFVAKLFRTIPDDAGREFKRQMQIDYPQLALDAERLNEKLANDAGPQ